MSMRPMHVSLVVDPPGQRLYPQYGFEDVAPGIGMFRCLRIQRNKEAEKLRRESNGFAGIWEMIAEVHNEA